MTLLLSLAQDFPDEWHRFVTGGEDFAATVRRDHFPYFTQGRVVTLGSIRLIAIEDGEMESTTPDLTGLPTTLGDDGTIELSLAEYGVLVRGPQARVFLLISYSL